MGSDTMNTTRLPLPPYVSWYVPSPGHRQPWWVSRLELKSYQRTALAPEQSTCMQPRCLLITT